MALNGYSSSERQKVIEETVNKLYAVICEGSNEGSFREKVLTKTTENLNDILTSKDAQVEIKDLIFKGIKISLEDPDYMKPLLFKSMLNMGSVSPIMANLFKEALSTSTSSKNKGLNDFLEAEKGILDDPPNPDKGGSAQNEKQTGGAELLAEAGEGLAEGAAESAASVGAAAAETAAEGAAASAATAAESAGASAVATAEKEGAELAEKGEDELAKEALKGKDGKPLTPEEKEAAEKKAAEEAEKKTQDENMKKGIK